jgi:hypothetical protein
LANIGEKSTPYVIKLLNKPAFVEGALITLGRLPIRNYENQIKNFVNNQIQSALQYYDFGNKLNRKENKRVSLLVDSLYHHAHKLGIQALYGLSLLSDRESMQVAIDNLQSKSPTQKANALETLEAVRNAKLIKPLLQVWESSNEQVNPQSDYAQKEVISQLTKDSNAWISTCAKFVAEDGDKSKEIIGEQMDIRTTLPIMERVLLLRHVPLFADLSPADLQPIASLVTEHHAEKDEVIFEQGEIGEEMFVVVHGEVQVMIRQDDDSEKEVARRKVGDVVGEMSIISGEPRIASLIAVEETHFLCLDKKSFEGLIRERPEVGFAVMRVLCVRLKEATK